MILWGANPTECLFDISVCRYYEAEAVMWAVGATALVSLSLTLFALQSKVRSVTQSEFSLQCSQKWHFINCGDFAMQSVANIPHTELCFLCSQWKSVKLSCFLMQCLLHAVTSRVLNLRWVCCPGKTMISAEISVFVNQVNSLRPVVGQS